MDKRYTVRIPRHCMNCDDTDYIVFTGITIIELNFLIEHCKRNCIETIEISTEDTETEEGE